MVPAAVLAAAVAAQAQTQADEADEDFMANEPVEVPKAKLVDPRAGREDDDKSSDEDEQLLVTSGKRVMLDFEDIVGVTDIAPNVPSGMQMMLVQGVKDPEKGADPESDQSFFVQHQLMWQKPGDQTGEGWTAMTIPAVRMGGHMLMVNTQWLPKGAGSFGVVTPQLNIKHPDNPTEASFSLSLVHPHSQMAQQTGGGAVSEAKASFKTRGDDFTLGIGGASSARQGQHEWNVDYLQTVGKEWSIPFVKSRFDVAAGGKATLTSGSVLEFPRRVQWAAYGCTMSEDGEHTLLGKFGAHEDPTVMLRYHREVTPRVKLGTELHFVAQDVGSDVVVGAEVMVAPPKGASGPVTLKAAVDRDLSVEATLAFPLAEGPASGGQFTVGLRSDHFTNEHSIGFSLFVQDS